jgi:DNA helicase TIP49 (TBP-interacting protein)
MKTTDMETIYDLGTKMIDNLIKEKVQSGYENWHARLSHAVVFFRAVHQLTVRSALFRLQLLIRPTNRQSLSFSTAHIG